MPRTAWLLLILLLVLHQDWWNWGDSRLLGGIAPIGLAWHVGISIAAALFWLLVVTWWWPAGLDLEDEPGADAPAGGRR